MSSHRLEDCSVNFMAALCEFELQMHGSGISFVRACTYRSDKEQNALYKQGRSLPGRIATWAKAGQSPHNDKCAAYPASNAADYYPLLHGKLCDNKTVAELALWRKMGQIGKACGLEWGGDWQTPKQDMPHFQLPKKKRP